MPIRKRRPAINREHEITPFRNASVSVGHEDNQKPGSATSIYTIEAEAVTLGSLPAAACVQTVELPVHSEREKPAAGSMGPLERGQHPGSIPGAYWWILILKVFSFLAVSYLNAHFGDLASLKYVEPVVAHLLKGRRPPFQGRGHTISWQCHAHDGSVPHSDDAAVKHGHQESRQC